ncbi:hypothetical protein Ancab_002398, partial [Ancistrocladus abbreviatus]
VGVQQKDLPGSYSNRRAKGFAKVWWFSNRKVLYEGFSSFLISDEEVGFLLLAWFLLFLFRLILALMLEGGGDLVGG